MSDSALQKPRMHWYLGAKGGTGKTLLALTTALDSIFHHEEILIVDLNFHNADLAELMRPFGADGETETVLGDTGFAILPIKYSQGMEKISYLAYAHPGGDFFGKVPLGIQGIYDVLNRVLSAVEKGTHGRSGFSPKTCIVDTSLHLSNLLPPEANTLEKGISEYSCIDSYEPFIWFNWTIATALRLAETLAAQDALAWLSRNNWLKVPGNVIHVMNPYVLTRSIPLFGLWPSYDMPVNSLKDFLENAPIGVPIELTDLSKLIDLAVSNYIGDDINVYYKRVVKEVRYRSIPEAERSTILGLRKTGDRPRNVFPVPYFRHSLAGYTDALGQQGEYGFSELRDRLGSIYDAVEMFLDALFMRKVQRT